MIDNKYDPRKKQYGELTRTFACGEPIFEEILEDLRPDEDGTTTRQSWIITGPRGAGKSHLTTLLYQEITKTEALATAYLPLIFPEELFAVDSLYRLLVVVIENLVLTVDISQHPQLENLRERFHTLKRAHLKGSLKAKKEQKQALAKELLELLLTIKNKTDKKIVLLLENLQYLLRDQIPEDDQKLLRSFLNENAEVFIIIGTSLTIFNEIENYGKPFYHYFRVRNIAALTQSGILAFLEKIASFHNHDDMRQKIEENRHYIYTYNILTGGNPRLVLFLYELLLDNDRLDTKTILQKVSELTPYFLDKIRMESPQRRLILDALVTGCPAQTATEIADNINEEPKSITEQLKRLVAEGWIRAIPLQAKDIKKKEVFYTLKDYFFRIWYHSRMGRIDRSEVYYLAELVTLMFNKSELYSRLERHRHIKSPQQQLYETALKIANDTSFSDNIESLVDVSKSTENEQILKVSEEVAHYNSRQDWHKIITFAKERLEHCKERQIAYLILGFAYSGLKEYEKSYFAFIEYINLASNFDILSFRAFQTLSKTAGNTFSYPDELHTILDKESTSVKKIEAMGKLILLDKYNLISELSDEMLDSTHASDNHFKVLVFFLEGLLLDMLGKEAHGKSIQAVLKSWIRLNARLMKNDETKLKKKYFEFFLLYIELPEKEKNCFDIIDQTMNERSIRKTGIPGILLSILNAVITPDTREAQKMMADPLFKKIVTHALTA